MIWITLFTVISLIAVVATASIITIPANHFGVVKRFGGRTRRIMREGFNLKLPLVDSVELISQQLAEITVTAKFTTKDKIQLRYEGSLQYRPDPRIQRLENGVNVFVENLDEPQGVNVFIEMSEEIISSGISDRIKSLLGALGGLNDSEKFIKQREVLKDVVNSMLRAETPPHVNHDPRTCGLTGCTRRKHVDIKDLIGFYQKHRTVIRPRVEGEDGVAEDFDARPSDIELLYGIQIDYFAPADVGFTEETEKALEDQRQAEFRGKAAEEKIRLAAQFKEKLEASAQVAIDAADTTLDPDVKKQVVSVQGEAGVLGALAALFGRGR